MNAQNSLPPDNFEGEIKQARANFRKITELKEKLDLLTEHVESRKEALEEEIEESLHEAVSHGRDCLEKIQENIEPQLEKVIRTKLEEIDKKMTSWKQESLLAVKEEIKNATPALTKQVLYDLDQVVVEKVKLVKDQVVGSVKEEVGGQIRSALQEMKEDTDKKLHSLRMLVFASIGLGGLAVIGVLMLFAAK